MIFEQHYLDCLSQASYLIGDEQSGRAVVVDPRRDIAPYVASAEEHGLTIELVIETHFHADFLSGHLELAAATGAPIAYGSVAEPEFDARKLAHGERISLGDVELEIRHTPGHTPESISIVVHNNDDHAPYGVLTGDTLFIGDVGRPDLLSSQGVTKEDLAGQLYDSLHEQLLTLPDTTKLYPGHGAGSACGKNLSSATSSTIGEQRASNYALQPMSRSEFIEVVTAGQSAPPAYFSYDAALNKAIRPLFDAGAHVQALSLDQVLEAQAAGATIIDSRPPHVFAAGHVRGSLNVGLAGRFAEYVGGVVRGGTPLLIVAEPGAESETVTRLARIGFDQVLGYLKHPAQALIEHADAVSSTQRHTVDDVKLRLRDLAEVQLVDVRQPGETAGGVLVGARLLPLTQLVDRLGELDADRPTLLYCAGGYRSMIAASVLENAGFDQVGDLIGGYGAWTEAGQPVAEPAAT